MAPSSFAAASPAAMAKRGMKDELFVPKQPAGRPGFGKKKNGDDKEELDLSKDEHMMTEIYARRAGSGAAWVSLGGLATAPGADIEAAIAGRGAEILRHAGKASLALAQVPSAEREYGYGAAGGEEEGGDGVLPVDLGGAGEGAAEGGKGKKSVLLLNGQEGGVSGYGSFKERAIQAEHGGRIQTQGLLRAWKNPHGKN